MDPNLNPADIPEGFTAADPTGAPGAGGKASAEAQAKEEQKRSILEQALTPEALARLGTVKVSVFISKDSCVIFVISIFQLILRRWDISWLIAPS